ncbi:hypothetical protein [Inhella sp.]|uniref:hypothetical protein n=1 Tax=Inhella sp. TaxID=1921806 RepID=UPI0035B3EE39
MRIRISGVARHGLAAAQLTPRHAQVEGMAAAKQLGGPTQGLCKRGMPAFGLFAHLPSVSIACGHVQSASLVTTTPRSVHVVQTHPHPNHVMTKAPQGLLQSLAQPSQPRLSLGAVSATQGQFNLHRFLQPHHLTRHGVIVPSKILKMKKSFQYECSVFI